MGCVALERNAEVGEGHEVAQGRLHGHERKRVDLTGLREFERMEWGMLAVWNAGRAARRVHRAESQCSAGSERAGLRQ